MDGVYYLFSEMKKSRKTELEKSVSENSCLEDNKNERGWVQESRTWTNVIQSTEKAEARFSSTKSWEDRRDGKVFWEMSCKQNYITSLEDYFTSLFFFFIRLVSTMLYFQEVKRRN